MRSQWVRCLLVFAVSHAVGVSFAIEPTEYRSHAPARPLPVASNRARSDGPAYFVATNGNDAHAGSEAQPWRTLAHAVGKLQPGDTLSLRGGTYHEHVATTLVGTAEKPITIRSDPGELAILDGGLREFLDDPATAWEPCPDGVPGEFWSTKTYSGLDPNAGDLKVSLLGNFADSMTPIHGYWNRGDLQSDNPFFNLNDGEPKSGKVGSAKHVYCGPGVWYDSATNRIHCRLAHTKLAGLGDNNYRGETDPRRMPLVLAPWSSGSVLTLTDSRFVRLQDLVLRGARQPTLWLAGGANLELDGLTIYGGQAPIKADGVIGLRMSHTACRGLAAPWTFRGSLKYRSIESRLFTTSGWDPTGTDGRNYEIAYCEFTDSVDGVFIGNIDTVAFHHNLLDNVSDDGVFVTAATAYDGETPGGGHLVFQNRFARCLSTFAFGVGHARQKIIADAERGKWGTKQLGRGLTITRNVFDFRQPVHYHWPAGPDEPQELTFLGRFAGDHGSPGWEPMTITHNTLLTGDPPRYEYATNGFSGGVGNGSRRRVFNNIVCQLRGLPGQWLPDGKADYAADGNLLWSASDGSTTSALPKPRYPRDQTPPPETWTARDQFADPNFVVFDPDWRKPVDLRLRDDSPAVNRGVEIPAADRGLDPLRSFDEGIPDVGAVPRGVTPWRVGCRGRLDVFGNVADSLRESNAAAPIEIAWVLPGSRTRESSDRSLTTSATRERPIAVVTGYPAFEAPLVTYALRKRGMKVVEVERAWLDPSEFAKYGVIVFDGSFARAGVTPTKFADNELPIVRKFLEDGGTLWLFRERFDLFASESGRRMLIELGGPQPRENAKEFAVLMPQHPWVAHLTEAGADHSWLAKGGSAIGLPKGDVLIGTATGKTLLGRVSVGKGQIIYVGWSIAASLPNGRVPPTVADERRFDDQMRVLTNIVGAFESR